MEVNTKLRAAKYGYIVLSILICVLGIAIIAVPSFSISMLCWIGGVLLIIFGGFKILGYLSKDLYRLAFQYDLAFGILLCILGILLILRTNTMVHMICILLGIFILADSLLKIQIAIDARAFGLRLWWMILTVAIITSVISILLLFRPYESSTVVMILLGISLLGEGLLNLTTVLTAVKILQKKAPTFSDSDFFD